MSPASPGALKRALDGAYTFILSMKLADFRDRWPSGLAIIACRRA
jgi:hypothetical protein